MRISDWSSDVCSSDLQVVEDADLVIVHEWTDPAIVAALGALRKRRGAMTLLFHDTHHRMVSDPEAMSRFDLSGYDGILAFGATLVEIYRKSGWDGRTFVWHEIGRASCRERGCQ